MTAAADTPRDEIAEKAAYWTSEVVNLRLRETFPGEERGAAAIILSGLVGDDPADPEHSDEASCRLMLDAIKLSDGSLTKLRLWVEAAHVDPRDLIAAAEYRRQLQDEGEGEDARLSDLDEYVAWLEGRV